MARSLGCDPMRFFVYGTLLPGEVNHDLLLRGRTSEEIPAILYGARMWSNGQKFELPGRSWPFPFVALDDDPRLAVTGTLVTIAAEFGDDVRRALDDLETYTPGATNNRYERVRVSVEAGGENTECWTYVAADRIRNELRDLPVIADGDWLRYLVRERTDQG